MQYLREMWLVLIAGFVVAAKSVLRFGEARNDQKLAEYILIGTLLSFGLAIVAASVTKRVLTGV
jgi:hypothetical protein